MKLFVNGQKPLFLLAPFQIRVRYPKKIANKKITKSQLKKLLRIKYRSGHINKFSFGDINRFTKVVGGGAPGHLL